MEFLSGIADGITTGETIRFRIPNVDVKVSEANRHVLKPSHASYTYMRKYGVTDNEQCGRASARQTVCRVVAGAIAKLWLKGRGVRITSRTLSIAEAAREGDSVGALVEGRIQGLPAGLGEPVYDKFSARLAYAMMSINAAKGFVGVQRDLQQVSNATAVYHRLRGLERCQSAFKIFVHDVANYRIDSLFQWPVNRL